MKKNILIGVLLLIIGFFVLYAQIKATEAENAFRIAEEQRALAEQNARQAQEIQQAAEEQAALAAQQMARCNEELEQCRK